MEKIIKKYGKIIVTIAMMITTISVNSTCPFATYQPKLPSGSEKLKKANK